VHERERHRIIISEANERPVVTVAYLVDLLGASEATIRRDLNSLHKQGRVIKVRGGVEALRPPTSAALVGRPLEVSKAINADKKACIARAAASLCSDGDSIILGGGSTVLMMAEYLKQHQMHVLTNSFTIADYLLQHSKNVVNVPAGRIYREQNLILSPFHEDGSDCFFAKRLFIGAQGVGPFGVMETDPQIVQASSRLLKQAEQKVLVVDSSKFEQRSSLVLCSLAQVDMVITDSHIDEAAREMLKHNGVELVIADASSTGQLVAVD